MASDLKTAREKYLYRTELIETARAEEIASLTDERVWEIMQTLKPFVDVAANPGNGAGLVEQQALFKKQRQK